MNKTFSISQKCMNQSSAKKTGLLRKRKTVQWRYALKWIATVINKTSRGNTVSITTCICLRCKTSPHSLRRRVPKKEKNPQRGSCKGCSRRQDKMKTGDLLEPMERRVMSASEKRQGSQEVWHKHYSGNQCRSGARRAPCEGKQLWRDGQRLNENTISGAKASKCTTLPLVLMRR